MARDGGDARSSSASPGCSPTKLPPVLHRALRIGTFAFPVWVLLASLLALWRPEIFTWFRGDLITVGLGLIMLGMGLTLEVDDFRRVLRRPAPIGLGVVLQYLVMPLMGWTVAWALDLPREFAVGLILVFLLPRRGGLERHFLSGPGRRAALRLHDGGLDESVGADDARDDLPAREQPD